MTLVERTTLFWNDYLCPDIWESKADVFASIANYFKEHGWKEGGPIFQKVTTLFLSREQNFHFNWSSTLTSSRLHLGTRKIQLNVNERGWFAGSSAKEAGRKPCRLRSREECFGLGTQAWGPFEPWKSAASSSRWNGELGTFCTRKVLGFQLFLNPSKLNFMYHSTLETHQLFVEWLLQLMPNGPKGNAYLVCSNFRVILRYNSSSLYGFSVCELARLIEERSSNPYPTPAL